MKYVVAAVLAFLSTGCTIVPLTPTIHVRAPKVHLPVPVVVVPGVVYRHEDWDD